MATPIDVVMFKCRKICPPEIDEIVRYLLHKYNFGSHLNCRYCAYRAKNLRGPAPTFGLYCSNFIQISSLLAEL